MNGQADIFRKLMEKYRFMEPVSPAMQVTSLLYKREILVGVLRASGSYSIIYGLSLRLFFRLRSLGSGITSAQCVALTCGIIASVAALLSAITIYIAIPDRISAGDKDRPVPVKPDGYIVPHREDLPGKKMNTKAPCIVLVEQFTAENVDTAMAWTVADALASGLKSMIGEDAVGIAGKERGGRIIMGSVGRMGNVYLISARMVDAKSGRLVFSTTEKVEGPDNISDAGIALAKRIGRMLISGGGEN